MGTSHTSSRPPTAVVPPSSADIAAAHLAQPAPRIEAFLDEITAAFDIPENLRDAVRYALLGGGKRLRPVLAWYAAAAVTDDSTAASLPAGAAVELVHAFSLVHDDLPAMDDDDLRRGRPTLHRHTSEAMAILAGDAMLNFAFQVLLERAGPAALAAKLCHELAIGTSGMITGQVLDTLGGFAPGLADEPRLRQIHMNKTGALIRASCRMGALAGMCSGPGALAPDQAAASAPMAAISAYADAIGLMFQIVDDVLDVTQTTEQLGKRANKDIEAGKLTYPGVLGLERSRSEITRLHERAVAALAPLGASAEPLAAIASYLAVRTK